MNENDAAPTESTQADIMFDQAARMMSGQTAGGQSRAKYKSESYSATKAVGRHAKYGHEVKAPTTTTEFAMTPSELDHAKLGCLWKTLLAQNGVEVVWRDHERQLQHEIFTRDRWFAWVGDEKVCYRGHPAAGQKASLLNDTDTSYGGYLVPEWYDDLIVHDVILHSELLPYVTIRDIPFGTQIRTPVVGSPTVVSGLTEGSAADLFDCTGLVSRLSPTVTDCGTYLTLGRNLLADCPLVDLGQDLLTVIGQKYSEWCDNQIANGDGSTEPEGIFTKSGTTSVASTNGTAGPMTVADVENLCFGVPVARRRLGNCAYVCNDTMYRRARQVPVGASDARRIFGMDHQRYMLLEYPCRIESHISNGAMAFVHLPSYRFYRRGTPIMQIEGRGRTLTLANEVLVYLRARQGGHLVAGEAAAVAADFDSTDG